MKCNLVSLLTSTQLSSLSPSSVDPRICHLTSGNQAIWSSEGEKTSLVRWCAHHLTSGHQAIGRKDSVDVCISCIANSLLHLPLTSVVVAAIAWVINLTGRQPTWIFPIFPMMPSVLPSLMFTLKSCQGGSFAEERRIIHGASLSIFSLPKPFCFFANSLLTDCQFGKIFRPWLFSRDAGHVDLLLKSESTMAPFIVGTFALKLMSEQNNSKIP